MIKIDDDKRIENVVVIALIAVLVIGCFIILQPFLTALLWALILSIATWPVYQWLLRHLGGRRTPAAILMTLLLFAILLVPMFIIASSAVDMTRTLPDQVQGVIESGLPAPPHWLEEVPIVGKDLWKKWYEFSLDPGKIGRAAREYVGPVAEWLLTRAVRLGSGVLELTLSVLVTLFFFRDGAAATETLTNVSDRLAGERARHLIQVALGTIKGVVYGVLGGALLQAILMGIGLWMAGIPAALLLSLFTFFFALIPFGIHLIVLPAAIWLFTHGEIGWGIFLVVWGLVVVGNVDNVVRPYFISRGSALPFLLTLMGLLGGIAAFGLLGIFIGPTLLALGYTVLKEWGRVETKIAVGEGALSPAPPPPAT